MHQADTLNSRMAKRERTRKFKAFGDQLRKWRGQMPIGTAVRLVNQMGVEFDEASLRGWEYGWTGRPDPLRLLALTRVYSLSLDEVMAALRESRDEESGTPTSIPTAAREPLPTAVQGFVAVTLIKSPIAAGQPLIVEGDADRDTSLAFREDLISKFKDQVVCLRVGRREESMYPTILPGDVVLLDRREERRRRPVAGGIYAINFAPLNGTEGGAIKRIELDPPYLIVSSENPDKANDAYRTKAFDITDKDLTQIIQGEVVWFGRYMGTGRTR